MIFIFYDFTVHSVYHHSTTAPPSKTARPVSPDESHDFPRIEGKGNVFELEFRILFAEILDF